MPQTRKFLAGALAFFLATLLACGVAQVPLRAIPAAPDTICIATFNIQTFGTAKARKPEVMNVLAQTIAKFDVVAIQEMRDKSGLALKKLEDQVDALGRPYATIKSSRLGRKEPREQYAFMYRPDTLEVTGEQFH